MRSAKSHVSLRIRAVWSETTLGTLWEDNNPKRLQADSENCADRFESSQGADAIFITKTRLFKYIENFTTKKKKKNENFQIKKSYIFHISGQNIDCGYSLEPPRPL